MTGARAALLHLRLPFVYVLSPIFVWGAYAAGDWTARTTWGFALVHLCLYAGANAYNTAHDRDHGPIGGLARPPTATPRMAAWSAGLQALGALGAVGVGAAFGLSYVGLWGIFTAYSHPRTRLKRSPTLSLAAIVTGQGGLGWLLGWTAGGGGWPPDARGWWSALAAAAAVAALYPLTQLYQREADASRGEPTLADRLGVGGTLLWGAGGFAVVAGAAWAFGRPELAAYGLAVALGGAVLAVARSAGWSPSHGWVMAVLYANSTAILAVLAVTWP